MRSRTNQFGKVGRRNTQRNHLLPVLVSLFMLSTHAYGQNDSAQNIAPNLGDSPAANMESTNSGDSSENENDTSPKVPAVLLSQRKAQETLAKTVDETELEWLSVRYPGAEEQETILALKQDEKHPSSQGAILILHDTQQHADWPGVVRQIRSQLPFHGWATLSVNLPWPALQDAPKRERSPKKSATYSLTPEAEKALARGARPYRQQDSEQSPDTNEPDNEIDTDGDNVDINLTANSETQDPQTIYSERSILHLQAGLDKLETQNFRNIVLLAVGQSAELAIEYAQSKAESVEESGFTLILLDATFDAIESSAFGKRIGKNYPGPILDLINSTNKSAVKNGRLRRISAETALFRDYQNVRLPLSTNLPAQKPITKRIADWLAIHAPGERKTN